MKIELIIALVNSFTLIFVAWMTRRTEQNTNHMKDELVALTKTSSHAEGVLEEKTRTKEQTEAQIFPDQK